MVVVICDGCRGEFLPMKTRTTREYSKLDLCIKCYNTFEDLRKVFVREHEKKFREAVRQYAQKPSPRPEVPTEQRDPYPTSPPASPVESKDAGPFLIDFDQE